MMKKKIGILTFHNAINYGAILQCYALQTVIKEKGYNVEVLDYTPCYFNKVFFDPLKPWKAVGIKNKLKSFVKCIVRYKQLKNESIKQKELKRFISENLVISNPINQEVIDSFDTIITGSDQVWNLELLENDTTYLLDFSNNINRVSYAASFKVLDIDEFAYQAYKTYLPNFSHISVRENNLKTYLKKELNIESTNVLDPTLLLSNKKWLSLIKKEKLIKDKYLLIYYVNQPLNLVSKAFEYAKSHELKVISLNEIKGYDDYYNYSSASIEEFLNLIKNAEVIYTTSFHGMAFSIIFNKEFYFEVPENSYNNNERLLDLSNKLNLSNRNISLEQAKEKINWTGVNALLMKEIELSNNFLNDSI